MIDVRTTAEWSFVGVPDLSETNRPLWLVEWRCFPQMAANATFVDDVQTKLQASQPSSVFFICRSGARSYEAAASLRAALSNTGTQIKLFNVEEGFEGDLDDERHRGRLNGWKARGLPWRQA